MRNELEALQKNGRPGLRLVRVPDAGRMLHLQAPEEVSRLVRDFLLP